MLLAEVVGDVTGDDGDVDGGVELLELRGARLGAVFADVALREVKVRAQIGELDRGGVLQGDSLDARQDDVLGCETERGGVTGASATTRSGRGGRGFGRVGAGVRVADRQIWFGSRRGGTDASASVCVRAGRTGTGAAGSRVPISAPRPLRPQTRTDAPARRFMDSRPYTASWRECRSSSISPAAVIASSWFVRCFLARESSPESVEVGALLEAADDMNCSRGPHRR